MHKHPSRSLGFRLRRLSGTLDRQIQMIYETAELCFEPRWYPVVQLLMRDDKSVTDIAAELGISHPAVSQVVTALKRAGLINSNTDPEDERRRACRKCAARS